MSVRKEEVRRLSDVSAPERRHGLQRAAFFHDEDLRYLRFLIPPGARVLELGCGTGELLAALEPSFGVGVDFSPGMIAQARKGHPDLSFFVGDVEDSLETLLQVSKSARDEIPQIASRISGP